MTPGKDIVSGFKLYEKIFVSLLINQSINMKNPEYSIGELTSMLLKRSQKVLNVSTQNNPPIQLYFATGISEEAGEVCGVIRKRIKGLNPRAKGKFLKKLRENHEEVWKKSLFQEEMPPFVEPSEGQLHELFEASKDAELGEELADLFIQTIMLSEIVGVDLFKQVRNKFNKVSEELGCPEYTI